MPSPAAVFQVYSAGTDTSNLVTPVFAPVNGDVIVVKLATWGTGDPMGATSGGAQTYQIVNTAAPAGFFGWSRVTVTTVAGSPAPFAVTTLGTTNPTRHSMIVEHWNAGAFLAGSPATNLVVSGGGGPPSANITTVGLNSVVSWVSTDVNSLDPAGRAYLLSATEDGLFDGHIGANSVHYFAYANVGAPGVYTMGMTAPSPQAWTLSGVEIQFVAPSTGNPVTIFTPSRRRLVAPQRITIVGEGAPPPPPTPADVEWCAGTPVTGWAAGDPFVDWAADEPMSNWRSTPPVEDC